MRRAALWMVAAGLASCDPGTVSVELIDYAPESDEYDFRVVEIEHDPKIGPDDRTGMGMRGIQQDLRAFQAKGIISQAISFSGMSLEQSSAIRTPTGRNPSR